MFDKAAFSKGLVFFYGIRYVILRKLWDCGGLVNRERLIDMFDIKEPRSRSFPVSVGQTIGSRRSTHHASQYCH